MRNLESSRKRDLDDVREAEILRKTLLKQYGSQKESLKLDDMTMEELLKKVEELKTLSQTNTNERENPEIADREKKLALLKETGLFPEQEASKTTSPDTKEEASEIVDREEKLALLKKIGLFTEQEAGKATIDISLDEKEEAQKFESELQKNLRKLQERNL